MTPDRYEVSTAGRQRLTGVMQKRGTRMGYPAGVGFAIGIVFIAAGAAISLFLARKSAIQGQHYATHAPQWVPILFGAIFVVFGFLPLGMAWKQFAADRRRREAALRYPNEPALADYEWHPNGFEVSEWPAVAKAVASALVWTALVSIFNWGAFHANGPLVFRVITTVLDVVGVMIWIGAGKQLLRALKFGHSRVEFAVFPYCPPKPVEIRWQPHKGIEVVNMGAFTLRCVEEWTESHGTGKSRTIVVIHEEIWSAKWDLEQPRSFQPEEEMDLRFDLPADARSTQLAAKKPVFWELEVKLDLPLLGFKETYLVPVYSRA